MSTILSHAIWALPGVGLLGLCVYQLSIQQYDAAVHSFLSALAVFGLRRVDANTDRVVATLQSPEKQK